MYPPGQRPDAARRRRMDADGDAPAAGVERQKAPCQRVFATRSRRRARRNDSSGQAPQQQTEVSVDGQRSGTARTPATTRMNASGRLGARRRVVRVPKLPYWRREAARSGVPRRPSRRENDGAERDGCDRRAGPGVPALRHVPQANPRRFRVYDPQRLPECGRRVASASEHLAGQDREHGLRIRGSPQSGTDLFVSHQSGDAGKGLEVIVVLLFRGEEHEH